MSKRVFSFTFGQWSKDSLSKLVTTTIVSDINIMISIIKQAPKHQKQQKYLELYKKKAQTDKYYEYILTSATTITKRQDQLLVQLAKIQDEDIKRELLKDIRKNTKAKITKRAKTIITLSRLNIMIEKPIKYYRVVKSFDSYVREKSFIARNNTRYLDGTLVKATDAIKIKKGSFIYEPNNLYNNVAPTTLKYKLKRESDLKYLVEPVLAQEKLYQLKFKGRHQFQLYIVPKEGKPYKYYPDLHDDRRTVRTFDETMKRYVFNRVKVSETKYEGVYDFDQELIGAFVSFTEYGNAYAYLFDGDKEVATNYFKEYYYQKVLKPLQELHNKSYKHLVDFNQFIEELMKYNTAPHAEYPLHEVFEKLIEEIESGLMPAPSTSERGK